ncbi:MAG: tetratricopeptide repeat protein [Streptosporangiales bacterium]|nr:tetratricopeptide repeat protein [Streptosporangiales bacterium]
MPPTTAKAARPRPSRREGGPWLVALLSALVTGTTLVAGFPDLNSTLRIVITVASTVVAGVVAWLLIPPAVAAPPPAPPAVPVPAQLPPDTPYFTGRTDLLAELEAAFDAGGPSRSPTIIVITGQAGVGKTAVATRLAHRVLGRFPDGQLYVNLRGAQSDPLAPGDVLIGFLKALGVDMTTAPGGLEELVRLWRTWLAGRRVLVVLDNAASEEQVKPLLPNEPSCAAIVTSRRPLEHLTGTRAPLDVLPAEQAVELLGHLAGQARVAADPDGAREIVELCGALPLAVAIAGARLAGRPHWPLSHLAERLRDARGRLSELGDDDRGVRASIGLGYRACDELERLAFRRLGLLEAPDFPAWVVAALVDRPAEAGEDITERLVAAQLVQPSGTDPTGTLRYKLHDLVRVYARERAEAEEDAADRTAALDRMLGGYVELASVAAAARWPQDWSAESGGAAFWAPGERAARPARERPAAWLAAERACLVEAVEQAHTTRRWESCAALGRAVGSLCHSLRSFWGDWEKVVGLALDAARHSGDRVAEGALLLELQALCAGKVDWDQALRHAEEARAVFGELGDRWWAGRAERSIGVTLRERGRLAEAEGHLTAAIETFGAIGDRWWQARTRRNLAEVRVKQGRAESAEALLREALALFRERGNRYSVAQTLRALGEVLDRQDRTEEAMACIEEARELFLLRGERWDEARALRALGELGRPGAQREELEYLRRALGLLGDLGDRWGVARTEWSVGQALLGLDRPDEAADCFRRSAAEFDALQDLWWRSRAWRSLGRALIAAGRPDEARSPLEDARAGFRTLGDADGERRVDELLGKTS